ncbi:MAG: hypothetical protein GF331_19695 [Chitinivibrionales bacterium]|nr:hypothetical protein [Chitinivibrionales bacterium]
MMGEVDLQGGRMLTAAQLQELGLERVPAGWFGATSRDRTAADDASYGQRLYRLLRSPSLRVREQAAEIASRILDASRETTEEETSGNRRDPERAGPQVAEDQQSEQQQQAPPAPRQHRTPNLEERIAAVGLKALVMLSAFVFALLVATC